MKEIKNQNKHILCLDVSLNSTGYAIFTHSNNLVTYGTINTSKIELRNPEVYSEKVLHIFNELRKLNNEYEIDLILIERSFVQFNKATKAIQRVFGVIDLLFNKIEMILISPLSTKTLLCGSKKNIDKIDVLQEINFNYNLDLKLKDNDIADAIALAFYYFNKLI